MRILAKIGGAQIEDEAGRAEFAGAVALARRAGHEVILVHGGGNQIRTLGKRLGIQDRYHEGLRITDAETADVVLMVLAGLVNKTVVRALSLAGVIACGLTGVDGATFTARPMVAKGVELGYVGAIQTTNRTLVDLLLQKGIVPVIATVAARDPGAAGDDAHFYNLNADLCAGPLARAFGADAMLFLTDVPGVLGADKRLLASLDTKRCTALREAGVIQGGMIPKVAAALSACEDNPRALVKIAPATGDSAVLAALHDAVGTRFTR